MIACLPLTLIARSSRFFDRLCVYVLGGLFAYVASVNESNFDHQNYVNHINEITSLYSSGLAAQFAIAKDPIFLAFVDLSHAISTNYVVATIALISLTSIYFKVMATKLLPRRRTLFLSVYIIFLAPQFEFEAIRAALALSFILFSLTRSRWRTKLVLWVLSILSHASAIIVGFGIIRPSKFSWKHIISAIISVLVLLGVAFWFFPRAEEYIDNTGTVNSVALPIVTLLSISLGRAAPSQEVYGEKVGLLEFIYWSSLMSSACAIFIAPYMVTVSFRILAIAWVLYLFFFFLCKDGGSVRLRRFLLRSGSLLLLVAVMSYALIKNDTWAILLGGWR